MHQQRITLIIKMKIGQTKDNDITANNQYRNLVNDIDSEPKSIELNKLSCIPEKYMQTTYYKLRKDHIDYGNKA